MTMNHYNVYQEISRQMRSLSEISHEIEERGIQSDGSLASRLEDVAKKIRELRHAI